MTTDGDMRNRDNDEDLTPREILDRHPGTAPDWLLEFWVGNSGHVAELLEKKTRRKDRRWAENLFITLLLVAVVLVGVVGVKLLWR